MFYYPLKDNKQNHLEKLENHILLGNILLELGTIREKLREKNFLFCNHKYKDLLENH